METKILNSALFLHSYQHSKLIARKGKLVRMSNILFGVGVGNLAVCIVIPVILLARPSSLSTWPLILMLVCMMVGLGAAVFSISLAAKVREVTASAERKIRNLASMLGLDVDTLCGMEVATIKERGEKRLVALAKRSLIFRHSSREIRYGKTVMVVVIRVQRYVKRTEQNYSGRLGDLYDLLRELELTAPGGYEWAYTKAKRVLPF